eukprot:TRINITY_DN2401_c0_g1_i1.p1 TRINITY_DN2401_c0_g1~~TRINITY_DN2401_c0_g1_i1.p1  ORF type:complete len:64 (+),score=18.12 TRINITY_DN2401_c0_g1_i1:159-350(+)
MLFFNIFYFVLKFVVSSISFSNIFPRRTSLITARRKATPMYSALVPLLCVHGRSSETAKAHRG